MFSFLQTFEPNPVLFQLGLLTIHWYGLTMVLGVSLGIWVVLRLAQKNQIQPDSVYDLTFWLVVFGLVGARVYAVLLEWEYFAAHPAEIIAVWRGGLAIHGAILGGLAALIMYARKKRQPFWLWADILAPAIALGQAFGRWGNYFNQELFGRPTDAGWGIIISPANRPAGFEQFQFFHPTFLYESILNLVNFGALLYLHRVKTKFRLPAGCIVAVYLANYAIIRIIMEQFRIDRTPMFGGVRVPIIASAVLLVVAAGIFIKLCLKPSRLTRISE